MCTNLMGLAFQLLAHALGLKIRLLENLTNPIGLEFRLLENLAKMVGLEFRELAGPENGGFVVQL